MVKKRNTDEDNGFIEEMIPEPEDLIGDSTQLDLDEEESPEEAESQEEPEAAEKQTGAQRVMAVLSDDDEERVALSLQSIICGDIIRVNWFKKQLGFLIMLVVMILLYITNRYMSQQSMIEIDALKRELTEMRYESMTRSSNLMQRTRESKILEYLKSTPDSALTIPTDPPLVIKVDFEYE